MKSIKFVKPLKEEEIDNLDWSDYTIVYHDEKDGLLKVAIPDYHNQIINDTFLEQAVASSNISFFRHVDLNELKDESYLTSLTINDGVVEDIYNYNSKKQEISYNGKILAKRLK